MGCYSYIRDQTTMFTIVIDSRTEAHAITKTHERHLCYKKFIVINLLRKRSYLALNYPPSTRATSGEYTVGRRRNRKHVLLEGLSNMLFVLIWKQFSAVILFSYEFSCLLTSLYPFYSGSLARSGDWNSVGPCPSVVSFASDVAQW